MAVATPAEVGPAARRAPLIALLVADVVSLTGNAITALAIPWFVLETTGSPARTGVVAFAGLVPTVLAALFGGALVDRFGHRRMSVLADLLSGGTVALVPLLHQTVGLPFGVLLGLVFLGALFDAPGATARAALFPDAVAGAGLRLERANAASQTIHRLAQLLGPVAAGLLIAGFGASNVLWLDAASFAVSAALVAALVPRPTAAAAPRGRYFDDLREGLAYLWRDRLVRALALTIAITNLLDAALSAVVLPVYARDVYGRAGVLGLMFGGFGAGAVAGSLLYAAVAPRLPRRATFLAAFLVAGLPRTILAAAPPLPVAVAVIVVAGLAAGPLNPILMTVWQERVPAELRGRVFGASTAIVLGGAPLGVLAAGYGLDVVGLSTTILLIGACYLLATASMLVNPALREMDDRVVGRGS